MRKRTEKLRRTLACLLALLLSLLSVGCSIRPKVPPDYRAFAFRAELVGNLEGLEIRAIGEYTPPREAGTPWDFTAHLTAPETLADIEIRRKDGLLSVSFGDLSLADGVLRAVAELLSLPATEGKITPIAEESEGDLRLLYAQIQGDESETPTELWLESQSGFPRKLGQGSRILHILSFEPISSDT